MLRIILPIVALALILSWFLAPKPKPDIAPAHAEVPVKKEESAPPPAAPAARNPVYTAPRTPIKAAANAGVPETCVQFWNQLRGLDLTQKDLNMPGTPPECAGKIPQKLQALHQNFLQGCTGANAGKPECEGALIFYRAGITDYLTKDTPVADINDPKVLTDKLLARGQEQNGQPITDGKAMGDIAERMLQVDPDSRPASQALLTSRIADATKAAGKPDDKAWEQVERALDHDQRTAQQGSSEQRQSLENRLFVDTMRYPTADQLADRAADISKRYPQYGVGPYYSAWAEFRNGNKERAKELLQEAMRREPNEPRYQESWQQLQAGGNQPFQPQGPSYFLNPNG